MFNSTGSVLRADLNAVVEEAVGVDRFFIGQQVAPLWEVGAKDGQYPKLTKTLTGLINIGAGIRRPGASYPRLERQWTSDTYSTYDRGVEEAVDDTVQKNMGRFFDAEKLATRLALRQVMLDHEYRVMEEVIGSNAATNWGAGTNSTVAYTVANLATVDFPTDLLAAIERCRALGTNPNSIVVSGSVLERLKMSTLLQNYLRGSTPVTLRTPITSASIQQAFADEGIENVYIGRAVYNSSKKGQTAAGTAIWNNTYVWVGLIKGGNPRDGEEPGALRTLVWNEEGGLWVTEMFREENIRSNVVRVRQHATEKCIDGGAGTLITTQYA